MEVATPLCNIAICRQRQVMPVSALAHAYSALLLDPISAKSYYQCGAALFSLEALSVSEQFLSAGLSINPKEASLLNLLNRLNSVKGLKIPVVPYVTVENFHIIESLNNNTASTKMMSLVNGMMMKMGDKAKDRDGVSVYHDCVPPFHTDFARWGLWPNGCHVEECSELLLKCYELSRNNFLELVMVSKPDAWFTINDVFQRLGDNLEDSWQWLSEAAFGDVRERNIVPPYEEQILHSFSNSSSIPQVFEPGKTHVAIGFVDLGSLRDFRMASGSTEEQFHWVGYEASPYCAAKSLVIAEMLSRNEAVDDIIQVWYSSTWSRSAHGAFRRAVTSLLLRSVQSDDGSSTLAIQNPSVLLFLRHWQLHDVSLAYARRSWLTAQEEHSDKIIANLKHQSDIFAMCRYLITGQLLEGSYGSVVMFAIPSQFKMLHLTEHFLYTIPVEDIMRFRKFAPDVVSAGVEFLREKITKLVAPVSRNMISIEIHVKSISLDDKETLSSIAARNPYFISWNNVCDYFKRKDFHVLARACSGPDTIHMGYSMNWVRCVKGASCLDGYSCQKLREMINGGRQCVELGTSLLGYSEYLKEPPIDAPQNFADLVLHVMHYRSWADAFFADGDVSGDQVADVGPPMYRVFSRCNSNIYFTYTYASDMKFVAWSDNYCRN